MLYRKNATLNEFSTLNMKILQHKQGSQLRNNRRQAPFLKAFGGNWKQEYFSTEHNVVSAKTHYYYLIDLNQINCLFLLPKLSDNGEISQTTERAVQAISVQVHGIQRCF
jgi:hypothetical protein